MSNIPDLSSKLLGYWGGAFDLGNSLQAQGAGKPPTFAIAGAGAVSTLDKTTAAVNLINTVTDTSLYSTTVPANSMPGATTGEGFRVQIGGLFFNNSGGNINFTLRLRFGPGVNHAIFDAFNPVADSTLSYFWFLDWLAQRNGATLTSKIRFFFIPAAAGVGSSADFTPTILSVYNNGGTVIGGFAIDQLIDFRAEMSVADPLGQVAFRNALIETFF